LALILRYAGNVIGAGAALPNARKIVEHADEAFVVARRLSFDGRCVT